VGSAVSVGIVAVVVAGVLMAAAPLMSLQSLLLHVLLLLLPSTSSSSYPGVLGLVEDLFFPMNKKHLVGGEKDRPCIWICF
jgi:hypothetical protein